MHLFLAQTNWFSGVTNVITGGVADGYVHEFEWWFAGFAIGTFIWVAGVGVRFVRSMKGRAGDLEDL